MSDAVDGAANGLGGEQRADDRDAERGADLANGRVGPARDARRARRDVGEDDVRQLRAGEAEPDAEEREARAATPAT